MDAEKEAELIKDMKRIPAEQNRTNHGQRKPILVQLRALFFPNAFESSRRPSILT